ncbi:hypothetical protein SHT67_14265 (plasmid) [Enterococcus faecalis]|uniref:hypothetical protein n=1 Tax=Enterococcus faecalis TaxID=1351 RepID=UPI0029C8B1CF|nr:hypothetical protein [Enterococcus faecalis]WPH48339.1 hypothetical protein SHT67_14265 [Enterococcus faecalis]
MRRKSLLVTVLLFVGCFFVFTQSIPVNAAPEPDENKVIIREPTTDVDQIYEIYKDNSFELMTQDMPKESALGIKEAIANTSSTIKNFTWAGVKGLGQFNAEMVKFLFSMDVVTPIKAPIQQLTSSIAENMLSIAGTIGISFVSLVMGIKFAAEQRFKSAVRVFLMTILIFTGLTVCKNANTANSFFNQLFDADKQIEAAFVKVNPVLGGESVSNTKTLPAQSGVGVQQVELTPDERMKSAGELIASRIFYTNVYEPYLLLNYGSSNPKVVREKQVEYKGTNYDRINILLDNDVTSDENITLHEKVTEYEAEELKNRSIMYFKNWENAFFGIFYLVVNLIQSVVYFVLCFVRLIVAVMQIFMLPLLPILLFTGLFIIGINVFANYFKGFGITIFLKAMVGFACIFFATFLSLGFQLSNAVDNPSQKILTILIYLLTPLGLYFFRTFIGGLFTGRVKLADAMAFATHPVRTERNLRQAAQEKKKENKTRRKAAQEERKAAIKKRKQEAKMNGAQDLGMKPKPKNEREIKRSPLRRELKQKPQHKAPNGIEKVQRNLKDLHEKGREEEYKDQQQLTRQKQRKALDKENKQTAAALAAANQEIRKRTNAAEGENGKTPGTNLKQNTRRTGQSSKKRRQEGPQTIHRQQGQKQPVTMKKGKSNGPKQRQTEDNRSTIRSHRQVSGQKVAQTTVTPKRVNQARVRGINGTGGSPLRHKPPVRQKMQAVQQVINSQQTPNQENHRPEEVIVSPITRMGKRSMPPVKTKKSKNKNVIRRSIKKTPAPEPRQSTKGMRTPRARK